LSTAAAADQKTEEILLMTAAASDIISTEWALAHRDVVELNPLMQSPISRIAVKAGVTTGLILLARKFDRDGRHGAAKCIRWPAIGLWMGATGWNISVSISMK